MLIDIERLRQLNIKKIVVGVSGGADSMALLNLLLSHELGWDVVVAHVEHGIRGNDSQGDCQFVIDACEKLGVPCFYVHADIPKLADGANIENTARNFRYEYFKKVKADVCADCIAVAHHGDDNLETIIMNMVRGCGLNGLCGMDFQHGDIIRPLLYATKQEILDYCVENNIPWREDITNKDTTYVRNNVRENIIPALKDMNPNLINTISKNVGILKADHDFIEGCVGKAYSHCVTGEEHIFIDVQNFLCLDKSIQYGVVKKTLQHFFSKDMSLRHYNHVIGLMDSRVGTQKHIKDNVFAYRCNGKVAIYKSISKNTSEFLLEHNQKTVTDFGTFDVKVLDYVPADFNDHKESIAYFDFDAIKNMDITVRTRIMGDMFRPINCGEKKLKDFFIDLKIENFLKDSIPLVLCGNKIVWAVLLRQGDAFKILNQTKKVLMIEYSRNT